MATYWSSVAALSQLSKLTLDEEQDTTDTLPVQNSAKVAFKQDDDMDHGQSTKCNTLQLQPLHAWKTS